MGQETGPCKSLDLKSTNFLKGANMRLKYDPQTGEIIAMGYVKNLEGAIDVDFGFPSEPLNYFTFDGTKLVRKSQAVIDKIVAEQSFSFHKLMGRLNQTLNPASIMKLAPYSGAMQSFCDWKNWNGIRTFLNGLVVAGIATAEEVSVIVEAFLEQGIDLAGE
jgi:hypothetical protein